MKARSVWLKPLLYILLTLLASCTTTDHIPVEPSAPSPPQAQSPTTNENLGEQVARHLAERYDNKTANCGSASAPHLYAMA